MDMTIRMNSRFMTIRMKKEMLQNHFNSKNVFPPNLCEMSYLTEIIDLLYFLNSVNIVLFDFVKLYIKGIVH